jgi:hypothetical protein
VASARTLLLKKAAPLIQKTASERSKNTRLPDRQGLTSGFMVLSFVIHVAICNRPAMRQSLLRVGPKLRATKDQSILIPKKMVDTYLLARHFAYATRVFLSLERKFHQLKNRESFR